MCSDGDPFRILGNICKLDVEKAYVNLNWEFLLYLYDMIGLGVRWMGWTGMCISIVRFLVLISGIVLAEFEVVEGG